MADLMHDRAQLMGRVKWTATFMAIPEVGMAAESACPLIEHGEP